MASFVWVLLTAIVALLRFTAEPGLHHQVGGRARLPGRSKVFSNPHLLETGRVKPLKIIQVLTLAIPYRSLGWK